LKNTRWKLDPSRRKPLKRHLVREELKRHLVREELGKKLSLGWKFV
jgi:hypothetical protein